MNCVVWLSFRNRGAKGSEWKVAGCCPCTGILQAQVVMLAAVAAGHILFERCPYP